MSHGRPHAAPAVENSLSAGDGWHCSHFYYRFNRAALSQLSADSKSRGVAAAVAVLDPKADNATERLQTSIVSGHKADFGVMIMDPNPLKIDSVHQRLMNTELGPALEPTYSFVSISEISEYVPTIEQYSQRLVDDGEEEGSDSFNAKLDAYKRREPIMRYERLTPDFPDFPAMCFYPMNKKRKVGENWFTLPFDERNRMMNEHARSGMAYAGRIKQLITVGVGIEDWEWGVTLWGANPQLLTDIVYKMRFDEASARYGEFGPFYTSYVSTAEDMFKHCLS
ncbi:MAG: heme-dependent peroxidase [Planctomycetales bacterium]|nr:heme-dependent peroxidase [Planctomycetales bacterium]